MIDFLIDKSQWILVVGALVTVLGTYLASKKSDRDGQKQTNDIAANKHLSEQSITLTKENNRLSLANNTLSEQNRDNINSIKELTDKNLELSKALSNQALGYHNYTIGKNSYCYLEFITSDGESGNFIIQQVGKNPLQGVHFSIEDITNRPENIPLKSFEDGIDWAQSVEFGTINPLDPSHPAAYLLNTKEFIIKGRNYIKFHISIQALGHVFTQILEVKLKGRTFLQSTKLADQNSVTIFSKDDLGFESM